MLKLPINGLWSQPNSSDKFGSLWATKNVSLDELGHIKLSPRSVKLLDEAANADLGVPLAIGRYGQGSFQVATSSNANFVVGITTAALGVTEDSGTADPTLTADSHAVFFHGYWLASLDTSVYRKAANGGASATWTDASISLTTAKSHFIAVFDSRNTVCIANGNTVVQYTETGGTFTVSTQLTIPSDYEVVGLAYNNGQMAVITQSGLGSTGELTEAKFYLWNGSVTSATGYGVGAEKCLAVAAFKSSFVVLTSAGKLLYFNGGGFEELAQLPFFSEGKTMGSLIQTGNCMTVDGDRVLINIGLVLANYGRKQEQQIPNLPSGVWCYDHKTKSLYHRYSHSNSQIYLISASASGVNTTTNIITAAAGTLPTTGNPIRFVSTTSGATIGGVTRNKVYFIIKHDATTFSLAETKALADAGVKLDLTATNADTVYFHGYEIVDYGVTYQNTMSAVALLGEPPNNMYEEVIFGADIPTIAALGSNDVLCMTVPEIESRGWVITPKIFSETVQDVAQTLYVKFNALKSTDSIVVKVKDRDVAGLPVSSPGLAEAGDDEFIWSGATEGITAVDLSEAEDYLNAGGELECEFTAGAGAGQTVKISAIVESSGVYTVTFAESVVGAASTKESYFIINNWRTIGTATSSDKGFKGFLVGSKSTFVQFKIEMRGSGVIIEEIGLVNTEHKTT